MFIAFASLPAGEPEPLSPTHTLRAHLRQLRQAIAAAERLLQTLEDAPASRVGERLFVVDQFLTDGLLPHINMEERVFTRVIDGFPRGQRPSCVEQFRLAGRIRQLTGHFHRNVTEAEVDLTLAKQDGLKALAEARAYLNGNEMTIFPFFDTHLSTETVEAEIAEPLLGHGYGTGPTEHHASSHHMEKFHHKPD